jgi:hypothetical protein
MPLCYKWLSVKALSTVGIEIPSWENTVGNKGINHRIAKEI